MSGGGSACADEVLPGKAGVACGAVTAGAIIVTVWGLTNS